MSRFISGRPWQPVIVIDRRPRRRTSSDVIGMIVALSFLLLGLAYAITEEFCK